MSLHKCCGIRILLLACLFVLVAGWASRLIAQGRLPDKNITYNISFQRLSTENGLSYLGVNDLCLDKNGILWIATGNGLNSFNGKTVEKFYAAEYPQLQHDFLLQVMCDDHNRIWVLTDKGEVTMIDRQRRFHQVGLIGDKGGYIKTRSIVKSTSLGVILFTDKGHYRFMGRDNYANIDSLGMFDFQPLSIGGLDSLTRLSFKQILRYDDETWFYVQKDKFFSINFSADKQVTQYAIANGNVLLKWNDDSVLLYNTDQSRLEVYNYKTGGSSYPFDGLKDQYGKLMKDVIIHAEQINDREILFSTRRNGIYLYDKINRKVSSYTHSVSDPSSLANNTPTKITHSKDGWTFIVTNPNGISYFNNNAVIGNQPIFKDESGRSYDGYITGILSEDNDTYLLGSANGLIAWQRSTNTCSFPEYLDEQGQPLLENEEVQTLCFDDQKRIWVATTNKGLLVLDKNLKLIRRIQYRSDASSGIKQKLVYTLQMSPDGYMWASGADGICRINTRNFAVDNLETTVFAQLDHNFVSPIFFQDADNIWIGIMDKGVWHYTFSTRTLKRFNRDNGLASNNVFSINKDEKDNIYIGTSLGLNILNKNGSIRTVSTGDGLLIPRAEALIPDGKGRMWIGNDIGLACYHYIDSSVIAFDERYGLSIYGFRVNAYYKNSAGEFVFGTPKGVQYFYPDDLFRQRISLNAMISGIETRDVSTSLSGNESYTLSPSDNSVTFYFSTVDYSTHLNTYYEYKLEPIDDNWNKVVDQNSVRYSSLPPGKYTFRLRVSNNNKTWYAAHNTVNVHIEYPFWQTWWFKLTVFAIAIAIIFYVMNYYRKRQEHQREELETEAVINYFASQINRHLDTDALLWDVVKNCISKLHFEDCVIYLLDQERNVLVQKAAYGPKNPVDFTISKPMEIPVGKGIVGSVAKSGKAEMIGNTATDPRYIVDDLKRNSELTVPLIIDNQIIGVIDSEHSKKNFFTQRHLGILNTIALLITAQLQRIKAEKENQDARMEVLVNRQRAAESRLQNLRLQMNPHFLFNALNSVQQMILANEELVATKYLSRFSKLLRTILIHSDKETISLKEELEILQLYIELESIRFRDSFHYDISCEDAIDPDEVKVPAMLIQPFVENAVWHGLMHKEGQRWLKIRFSEHGECIRCTIEDNGIGREQSARLKADIAADKKHKSKGIEVSVERLRALRNPKGKTGSMSIIDKTDPSGNPSGTIVEICIPDIT